jgi:hypothetical protein
LQRSRCWPFRTLPLRFIHVHTLNLSAWDGTNGHLVLRELVAHLMEAIGKPGAGA